jgi:hypothetical protein
MELLVATLCFQLSLQVVVVSVEHLPMLVMVVQVVEPVGRITLLAQEQQDKAEPVVLVQMMVLVQQVEAAVEAQTRQEQPVQLLPPETVEQV